jgi:hypothetical protein
VGLSVYLERLSRIESRRAELKIKRAESGSEDPALDRQITALDAQFEAEAKQARAARKLEDEDTMHRAEIERLRQLVAGLDAILRGDLPSR